MPSYGQPEQWVAGGTIGPSRFVKISTAADHTLLQSGAADPSYGISQVGMLNTPGLLGSDLTIAANATDQIQVYPFGCIAPILCAGTVTAGAFVKSDANGEAVAASSGNVASGIMVEAGSAGIMSLCKVLPPGTKMP